MNHPDGDCPLCLCPLLEGDEQNHALPFMKLMSCFHCFHRQFYSHYFYFVSSYICCELQYPSFNSPFLYLNCGSECIIRWWNWLQTEQVTNHSDSSTETTRPITDMGNRKGVLEEHNCNYCVDVVVLFCPLKKVVWNASSSYTVDIQLRQSVVFTLCSYVVICK